jgi:hypothetical protein
MNNAQASDTSEKPEPGERNSWLSCCWIKKKAGERSNPTSSAIGHFHSSYVITVKFWLWRLRACP